MTIYAGFCGPSNPLQSVLADCEKTRNLYVERVQARYAPTGAALFPTPGQRPRYTTTDVGTRAIWAGTGTERCFAVVGGGLWELFADGTCTKRNGAFGPMAQDNYPATISYNNNISTLGITSGGNWYNYDLLTNTLTQIAALNGKATMGGYKDGYYLCFNINNSTVYVSDLNDGLTWVTGVSYFQRSIASDPWQAMVVGNPLIYLIGRDTSEAWWNAGVNSAQPFAPIVSSFMQFGSSAPFSVGLYGNTITWLARDKNGADLMVSTKGYDPQPIANYAIATALGKIRRTSTLDDSEVFIYEEDGHAFVGQNLWTAKASWFVDLDTQDAHERNTWVPANNAWDAWHPRIHGFAFGRHLTGDRSSGVICESGIDIATESDGVTGILRERIGPPIWAADGKKLFISRFAVQADVGEGLGVGQGVNPQVMIESSEDGRTWGSQRLCQAGRMGEYRRKVFLTRLAASEKLWVPRLTVSDPIPWRFSAAEIDGDHLYQLGRAA